MSPDFLLNYLSLGPKRDRLARFTDLHLPLFIGLGLVNYLTPELLREAARVREESSTLPEHIIRRRVRDQLDSAKRRLGRIARAGVDALGEDIYETEG